MHNRRLNLHRYLIVLIIVTVAIMLSLSTNFVPAQYSSNDIVTGQLNVNRYCVFSTNVDTGGITFGGANGLNPNANTIGLSNTVAVTDTGNRNSNILVQGIGAGFATNGNWVYGTNTFGVSNTIWGPTSNTAFSPGSVVGGANEVYLSAILVDTYIPVNTVSANSIYWGVSVPVGQLPGTYTSNILISSSC
jgi:hypothetical protein